MEFRDGRIKIRHVAAGSESLRRGPCPSALDYVLTAHLMRPQIRRSYRAPTAAGKPIGRWREVDAAKAVSRFRHTKRGSRVLLQSQLRVDPGNSSRKAHAAKVLNTRSVPPVPSVQRGSAQETVTVSGRQHYLGAVPERKPA